MKAVLLITAAILVLAPWLANGNPETDISGQINTYLRTKNRFAGTYNPIEVTKDVSGTIDHLIVKLESQTGYQELCDVELNQLSSSGSLQMSCKTLRGRKEVANFEEPLVQEALKRLTDSFNNLDKNTYRYIPRGGSVTKQIGDVEKGIDGGIFFYFKSVYMIESTCRHNWQNVGKITEQQCPVRQSGKRFMGKVNDIQRWVPDKAKWQSWGMDILPLRGP